MGLNKNGSTDCILTEGPCGGRRARPHPEVVLGAGETFAMTFQKNLDHFNSAKPGYFAISLGSENGTMEELYKTPDTATPALYLYTANVTMPLRLNGTYVLQAKYITNNPKAPAAFYQCADIRVVPPRGPHPPPY